MTLLVHLKNYSKVKVEKVFGYMPLQCLGTSQRVLFVREYALFDFGRPPESRGTLWLGRIMICIVCIQLQ